MNKKKSLNTEILKLIISFLISVIVIIGSLSIIKQYELKVDEVNYNQKEILKQVDEEIKKLISKIEDISDYLIVNYNLDNKNLLKNIVEMNDNISTILILNKKGIIEDFYATSNLNIHVGFDYSNKKYFKQLKKDKDYWSSVFLSTVDEEPTISFSFNMNNKIGVLMIKLNELSEFLERFRNSDGSHMIRVFDKNAVMIINPDAKELVLQRFNAISSEVFTKLIKKVEPFTQTIFKSAKHKEIQIGSYLKIDRTNWYVITRVDYDYILKSLINIFITFISAIIVFIIISVYLSFKISKNIFKSFEEMQKITSNIADGNYDVELKDLYYDEFNKLLESFNKMQSEIDKREESLQSSLESFKTLFNSTMESIVLSKNGVIKNVNDLTLKLLDKKSKDDFIGKNMLGFVAPKYRELVKTNIIKSTEPYEVELIKSDGSKIQVLVQGKLLNIDNEQIRLTAIIDITELKQKDKLIFQQSKMAAMGEMIGNIAHQWRQPLNTISTCASGAKFQKEFDVLSDDKFYQSMDTIVENTQYLSKTIDDFRNFFKTDKAIEKFVIKQSVEQALKLLHATLQNNNIKLQTNFLNIKFSCEGSFNEFIQVVINIINNAKDAFKINEIDKKYIWIDEYIQNDDYILEIKDNAGGIPLEIIDKVFDPYFTTKHKSQGTGIGLYMSHQIVTDHMKGTLNVKNIETTVEECSYKGACFSIKLPINYILDK